jgi:hypothetical protein
MASCAISTPHAAAPSFVCIFHEIHGKKERNLICLQVVNNKQQHKILINCGNRPPSLALMNIILIKWQMIHKIEIYSPYVDPFYYGPR